MDNFPLEVQKLLEEIVIKKHSPAFILVDENGYPSKWGGHLSNFGIENLKTELNIEEQCPFLEGIFPLETETFYLPFVSIGKDKFADIHIFTEQNQHWIMFLDVTPEAELRQKLSQKSNELRLLEKKMSKLD